MTPITTHAQRFCWYMSWLVPLPPLVAQADYDAQTVQMGPGRRRIVLASRRTSLLIRPGEVHDGGPGQPLRAHRALIHAGARWWPVDLELWLWSVGSCELGLRPSTIPMRRMPSEAVIEAGHDLLARLGQLMQSWAEQPLAELYGPESASSGDRWACA